MKTVVGMWLCLIAAAALAVPSVWSGCAAAQAKQEVSTGSASHETVVVEQAGQGNVSLPVTTDASGWTGLTYTSAVPVGQVVLMGLMLWLSHRREVLRIQGK